MTQLELVTWSPPAVAEREDKIAKRFDSWAIANRHVLDALLAMAREHLARGVEYLSVKKLWEEARVSLSTSHEGGYQLNNDFSSMTARWLIEQEPRLGKVIRLRARKS